METNKVREKLMQALETPNDDVKYQEYVDVYIEFLDEFKINADTVSLAIEGVDLDKGVNILDTFATLGKKEVPEAWKKIKESEELKKKEDLRVLKLLGIFSVAAISGEPNAASVIGNILTAITMFFKQFKQEKTNPQVVCIVREFIFDSLPKDLNLPEWKSIKMNPENMLIFCEIMLSILGTEEGKEDAEKNPIIFTFQRWLEQGMDYAKEAIELKEIEKNKPQKKSFELQKLAEHFKQLEDELDKSYQENAKLVFDKKNLQDYISKLEIEKCEMEERIQQLEGDIDGLNFKVNQINQEVDERKKLNDAQVQYREEAQMSLLQDIARALKAEYGDYAETKDTPMNEMLGEIYREKLKHIFKILDQKGVKVGE